MKMELAFVVAGDRKGAQVAENAKNLWTAVLGVKPFDPQVNELSPEENPFLGLSDAEASEFKHELAVYEYCAELIEDAQNKSETAGANK